MREGFHNRITDKRGCIIGRLIPGGGGVTLGVIAGRKQAQHSEKDVRSVHKLAIEGKNKVPVPGICPRQVNFILKILRYAEKSVVLQ